jgi:hypothetical protein
MDIYKQAYARGKDHAKYDKIEGGRNDAPLSGEWAGESIPELLGDLIREIADDADDETLLFLCDEYEQGYADEWENVA